MVEDFIRGIRQMPPDERNKEPTPKEIATSIRVLRHFAAETIWGEPKTLPLQLREMVQALVVEPAIEIIITDEKGRYALVPRPSNDSPQNKKWYGDEKLQFSGGFLKPNRAGAEAVGPIGTAIKMAKQDTGLDIVPISGPIAMYQWTRTKEHPTGWPLSLPIVFKVVGGTPKENIQWFEPGTLPPQEAVIKGNAGKIQRMLMAAYNEWLQNPNSFIDLNAHPLNVEDEE